jgi:aldose 1-epimerase
MGILLAADGVSVTIFPAAGGRLGQIEVDGNPLLRGVEDAALGWGWWGSYPLLPWSNRIPDGTFLFEDQELRVPVNWDDGSALHGLSAWVPWNVTAQDQTRVELEVVVTKGCYDVIGRQVFEIAPTHLDQTLEVTNRGAARVPVGLGIHPWFKAGPVRVPAELTWPGDGPMPSGSPVAVSPDNDLRALRVPPPMDRCYTGLTDTCVDVPGLRLHWTGPVTQVVVFSEAEGWVCVEPVTMANDGFALAAAGTPGTGVLALDAGESTSVTYRFEWRRD